MLTLSPVYERYGTETISTLSYLFGAPAIYTCSPEVARQIVSTRGDFFKSYDIGAITLYAPQPRSSYTKLTPVSECGVQISLPPMGKSGRGSSASSLRHSIVRRATTIFPLESAVSDTNNCSYSMLWKETARVFDEMVIGEGWSTRSSVEISSINALTSKVECMFYEQFMNADDT